MSARLLPESSYDFAWLMDCPNLPPADDSPAGWAPAPEDPKVFSFVVDVE